MKNLSLSEFNENQLDILDRQSRFFLKEVYMVGTGNYIETERILEKIKPRLEGNNK